MALIATPEFLSHLQSLYPPQASAVQNPWYIAAAVAFGASNVPEAVPLVFQHALKEVRSEDKILLVRKTKDALFKSGVICGYPKSINALVALNNALPEDLREHKPLRNLSLTTEELEERGQRYFDSTYGDTAVAVYGLLEGAFPDLGYFTRTMGYGFVYSFAEVTGHVETSYTMISALIAIDTPRQIEWHLHGAVRNGATVAEVKAVRQIAIEVSRAAGIKWKDEIPDL